MNDSQFRYHIENGKVFIDGLKNSGISDLLFPESIEGICSLVISEKAFAGNTNIKTIKLSPSVEEIMDYAFSNCDSLEYISFSRSPSIKIGKLILENCSNVKKVEMDVKLLKDLTSMFSLESYTTNEYRTITKKQLDNGVFYSSICSVYKSVSYDRDGDKEYHYSYTHCGYIPNKLCEIALYFTSQNLKTAFSIPNLKNFSHVKTIEFLDEVHSLWYIPKGFDVTRIKNFPKEIENINSEFFKDINAGSIHLTSKCGKVENGTLDQCTYEDLILDDDIELENYRLWKVTINGDLKLPEGIKNLFLHDVVIKGNFELPQGLINLKIYSTDLANSLVIPETLQNLECIYVDAEKLINNSSATSVALIGCKNPEKFKLNNGIKDLTLEIDNKEYSTTSPISKISYIPESVKSLTLGGYILRKELIQNCYLEDLTYTPRNIEELRLPKLRVGNLSINSGYESAIKLRTIDLSDVIVEGKLYVGYNDDLTKLISPLSAKEFECIRNKKLSLIVIPNHVEQDKINIEQNASNYTIVYPVTLKKYCYKKTTRMDSYNGPTKVIFKNPYIHLSSEMDWEAYTFHNYIPFNLKRVVFYGKENCENNELVPYWDNSIDYNSFSITKGESFNKKFQKRISNNLEASIEYPVGGFKENELSRFFLKITGKINSPNKLKVTVIEKQLGKVLFEKLSENDGVLCSDTFDFDFNNVVELGFLLLEIRVDEASSEGFKPIINSPIIIRF